MAHCFITFPKGETNINLRPLHSQFSIRPLITAVINAAINCAEDEELVPTIGMVCFLNWRVIAGVCAFPGKGGR